MLDAQIYSRSTKKAVSALFVRPWLTVVVASFAVLASGAHAAPGDIDATFGTGGVYTFPNAQGMQAVQSAVQSTGKVITVHDCGPQATVDVCVTRLTMDGAALDSTFATAGVFRSGDAALQEFARSVAVDNNDRIVVSARCGFTSPCVFRLTADGALDNTFGSGGYVRMASMVTAVQTAQMGDSRIVVIGQCFSSGHYVFCVNRLNDDGSQDRSFNGGALRVIDASVSNNQPSSLALYPDGRILMTGWCDNGGNVKFCVVRLALNGTLDTTFAGTGIKLYAVTANTADASDTVALQSSGRIIIGGHCGTYGGAQSTNHFCASALNEDGTVDTSFGSGGAVHLSTLQSAVYTNGMVLQADDKIVLAARCNVSPQSFCMVRLTAHGALDPTFGTGGAMLATMYTGGSGLYGAAAMPGNKIMLSGVCNASAAPDVAQSCIARFQLGAPTGEHCAIDLDDDGFIKPETDGVLWLRLLLGFRGNALTQNAVSVGARRSSAGSIYDHVYQHCGIR